MKQLILKGKYGEKLIEQYGEADLILTDLFERSVGTLIKVGLFELLKDELRERDFKLTDYEIELKDDGKWDSALLTKIENGEATKDDLETIEFLLNVITFVLDATR